VFRRRVALCIGAYAQTVVTPGPSSPASSALGDVRTAGIYVQRAASSVCALADTRLGTTPGQPLLVSQRGKTAVRSGAVRAASVLSTPPL
jgi:hypothetical protein